MKRKHDDDNLIAWLKSYRDGVADAGLVSNDSQITVGVVKQETSKKEYVILHLTEKEK